MSNSATSVLGSVTTWAWPWRRGRTRAWRPIITMRSVWAVTSSTAGDTTGMPTGVLLQPPVT